MEGRSGSDAVWITEVLKDLQSRGFYGKLTIEFKEGRVALIRKEETVKPPRR